MAEKKNSREDVEMVDSEEIIERLVPSSEGEDEVDFKFADDKEKEDCSIDRLFQDDDKIVDPAIDRLFEEDRKSFQKGLQDEVQKALSQPAISKASLFRMRAKEPSESALSEEIAIQKTVEEIWDDSTDEAIEVGNRKSVIVMCVFIALFTMAGGWALWQSSNDERGNEVNLIARENESIEKAEEKRSLSNEIIVVSGIIKRYFSAITVSQKSEHIYQAELFKNDIEAYYKHNEGVKPLSDYSIENVFPISLNGEQIWQVVIKNNDVYTDGLRSYYVRKNSDGEYGVDWKADVFFQDNDVKKFKETRSIKATSIKFIVEPMYNTPNYNWGFKDTEYQVLRLEIPNSDMVFWGYVKRGSPEQKKLNRYIVNDLKNPVMNQVMSHEFILKVRFSADSPHENDQYIIIDNVVSRKWINIDE